MSGKLESVTTQGYWLQVFGHQYLNAGHSLKIDYQAEMLKATTKAMILIVQAKLILGRSRILINDKTMPPIVPRRSALLGNHAVFEKSVVTNEIVGRKTSPFLSPL